LLGNFAGIKITFSGLALAETTERLFPASKYGSKRIHKKLAKRFGGVLRKQYSQHLANLAVESSKARKGLLFIELLEA
jgi:hypothetical protein